jgi:hypothetical protein
MGVQAKNAFNVACEFDLVRREASVALQSVDND